jgi:hypothetical protein
MFQDQNLLRKNNRTALPIYFGVWTFVLVGLILYIGYLPVFGQEEVGR